MTRFYPMRITQGFQACECGAMTREERGGMSYYIGIGGRLAFACAACADGILEREAIQRRHAAADPHCTCPDCISDHAAREAKS